MSLLLLAVRHLKPSYFHLHLVLRLGLGCEENLFVKRHLKALTLLVLLVKKAVLAVSAGDELLLVLQRHFECVSYRQLLGCDVVETWAVLKLVLLLLWSLLTVI